MKIVILDGWTVNPGDNPWDELARFGELVIYERTGPGEIVARAQDADIILTNNGFEVIANGPDGMRKRIDDEVPKWRGIIAKAGIKPV
jgi:hypothetical protein